MRRAALLLALLLLITACSGADSPDTAGDAAQADAAADAVDVEADDDGPEPAAEATPSPDDDPIAEALEAEGATVSLYWPANANFQAFIDEDLVPGFIDHVREVHGVEMTVDVLDSSGGDGAFLDRLAANAGRDGFPIDVARTAPSDALIGAIEDGLIAPLDADPALVTNLSDIDPAGLATFSTDDGIFGAPIYRPTMSLFYNEDIVEDPPTDLASLAAYAADNPGRLTYEDPRSATGTGSGTMFLLAVHHAFGDVTDPSSWDGGWDYLAELQDVIASQPQAGDQLVDLFARGEIAMMPYWNDAGLFAAEDLGIDGMRNVLLDEGFPIRFTPFVVPAGAAHPTAAMLFTDYMLGPEMQVRVAERMRQIPASTAAEVEAAIDDDTFGFPLADIDRTSFPAYDSVPALEAISAMNASFDQSVLGR